MSYSTCWVSPDGDVYPCKVCKHEEKAKELIKAKDAALTLESLGWLRLSDGILMSIKMLNKEIFPTQSQLNYVHDLFMLETDEYIKNNLEECLIGLCKK